MPHFIIALAEAAPAHLARIDAVRARHDPQHRLVAAHVTLVFGFEAPALEVVAEHVARVAASHPPISLGLVEHVAVRDYDDQGSHVFLLVERGHAEVVALHDALYAGPLARELRRDIAFMPHVTVAASRDHEQAEALARSLGRVVAPARLADLELVTLEAGELRVARRFELGGPTSPPRR